MHPLIEVFPGLWSGWESLDPDAPFLASHRWLIAREGRTDGPTVTFVAKSQGLLAAGLFATKVPDGTVDDVFNLPNLLTGAPRTILLSDGISRARAELRALAPGLDVWYPNLAVVYPGYECFPVGPQSSEEGVVDELVGEIVGWALGEGMKAVSFLYTSPENKLLDSVLSQHGFTRVHLTQTCDLNLLGETFEDYLAMLPAKRRRETKREIRRIRDYGITTVAGTILDRYEDLVRLGLEHSRKYGRRISIEKERRKLDGLQENFGDDLITVYCSVVDDEVLAFSLVLEYLGVAYALDSGTLHEDERSRYLYFDTVYYEPIRRAYQTGTRKIRYSVGTWEAKQNRGCDLLPREAWVLPIASELEPIVRRAGELLS